jgi:hypothetical protein
LRNREQDKRNAECRKQKAESRRQKKPLIMIIFDKRRFFIWTGECKIVWDV